MDRRVSVLVLGSGANARAIGDDRPGVAEAAIGPDLRVLYADGPDETVLQARQGTVDAVVTDEAAIGALGRLRARLPEVPILVLTEAPDLDAARHAIDQGADDVLPPADLEGETLARRIAMAIARKSVERRTLRHAREDAVTGLANPTLLEERFARALARADRSATLVGLVAIDLDGFDAVIAGHGQDVADRLLSMVGERLLGETRTTDTLARTRDYGFTWLVEGLPAIDDINALVSRLPGCLAEPFAIGNRDVRLTISAGVAVCPCHGRDVATVLAMAEAAMIDVSVMGGDALLMLPIPMMAKVRRDAALI